MTGAPSVPIVDVGDGPITASATLSEPIDPPVPGDQPNVGLTTMTNTNPSVIAIAAASDQVGPVAARHASSSGEGPPSSDASAAWWTRFIQ